MVTVQRSSCALEMRTANVNRQIRMKVILFTFVKFLISLRSNDYSQSEFSNFLSRFARTIIRRANFQISNLRCPLLADGHNVSGFLAEDDNGQVIAGEEVLRERHVGS